MNIKVYSRFFSSINTTNKTINLNKIFLHKHMIAKTKGHFESKKLFPRDYIEEHEDLKNEDYVNEIFDEDYYHFFHKDSDSNVDINNFSHQRIWFHWYIKEKDMIEKFEYGYGGLRWFYFLFPCMFLFFCIYIKPVYDREVFGDSFYYIRPLRL